MMTMRTDAAAPHELVRPVRSRGEIYEGLAFTFCKAAVIVLLTQRFALPVAAGAAAVFYLLAYRHGRRATRCVGQAPLAIAGFWSVVSAISLYITLRPMAGH
jgi:hypothetical protein